MVDGSGPYPLMVLVWAASWSRRLRRWLRSRIGELTSSIGPHFSSTGAPPQSDRGSNEGPGGRRCGWMGGLEWNVMWKAAAVLILVTVAGATAHAQQQQSAIETIGKTMSDLAKEGYEIKAAEDLSGDLPKFVLQKAESIVICQINFSDGDESCFQLRSRGR